MKEVTLFTIAQNILRKEAPLVFDENTKKVYNIFMLNRFLLACGNSNVVDILNEYINPLSFQLTNEEHYKLAYQLLPRVSYVTFSFFKKSMHSDTEELDVEMSDKKQILGLTLKEIDIFKQLELKSTNWKSL